MSLLYVHGGRYGLRALGMQGQDALAVYNWANLPEHIIASVGLVFFEHRIFLVFFCYSCAQVCLPWKNKGSSASRRCVA